MIFASLLIFLVVATFIIWRKRLTATNRKYFYRMLICTPFIFAHGAAKAFFNLTWESDQVSSIVLMSVSYLALTVYLLFSWKFGEVTRKEKNR